MTQDTFTPQEAAVATGASLSLIQKLITSRQIRTVGDPKRRRLDRAAVLAITLSRQLPRGVKMTMAEAHERLTALEPLTELTGQLELGGARIDLRSSLGPTLRRLDLLVRGGALVMRNAESGGRVIKGLGVSADDLFGRLQAGELPSTLMHEYPSMDANTINAVALWVEANPPRGRPRRPREQSPTPAPRDLGAWTRTMQITARQIHEWAASRTAAGALPRLVRRLTLLVGDVTEVTMPAGDSVARSGWDGELVSVAGNAWIPAGRSCWEMSCEASITSKANDDYGKRTKETPAHIRASSTLVIVTARRWSQKNKWVEAKRAAGNWSQVRAIDADDLEAWLEHTPAVALWFADELGLTGPGVESPARYWESWAQQAVPKISRQALFVDRERGRANLLTALKQRISGNGTGSISVKADSAEEAAAFSCAVLLGEPELSAVSLVVTDTAGWRFVEQNPLLKVVVASRPEIAERPSRNAGLTVVIPYAAGDMNQRGGDQADIVLERPPAHEFEQALCEMGADPADAKRLAATTGRSWSVFRRRRAANPSIRRPAWLDVPQSDALSVVCLLGGWTSDHAADREVVAKVANRSYEDVERDLRKLALLDDSPVLKLGVVWKAKAPLELLDLFGERITDGELDRFFDVAKSILTERDPQLELPDTDRYAAHIHGKVRPQSDHLINALCDTLIKLAVRGPVFLGLAEANIEGRVFQLVRSLLENADAIRWLSLASLLPQLAEAAPDSFLHAVESSLQTPNPPVTRLIEETSAGGFSGRCWHSGLLWALETLAWSPARLARVSFILAQLSAVPIKGNWGNTPGNSLLALFRPWIPQTAATLEQRIAVLDTLVLRHPQVAFCLLDALVNVGYDTATPSSRPEWRDDDAGAGHGATDQENIGMLVAAADRMIAMSSGQAERIAALLDKIQDFDGPRITSTLDLIEPFKQPGVSDQDRETIRAALRQKIHWLRNYGETGKQAFKSMMRLESLHKALEPENIVVRHAWLFAEGWPHPPLRVRDDSFDQQSVRLRKLREAALGEVFAARGLDGVADLATAGRGTMIVGITLAAVHSDKSALADWIVAAGGDFLPSDPLRATFNGLLRSLTADTSIEVLRAVATRGQAAGWPPAKLARLLVTAPETRSTWNLAEELGSNVEEVYWQHCNPEASRRYETDEFRFVLEKLLRASRPRSALQLCHYDFKAIAPPLLLEMLERMLKGEEPEGALLGDIASAVDALEANPAVDSERLARLEFGLLRLIGYGAEHKAKSLYRAVMTQPKLFTELLTLIYKPRHSERVEILSDQAKNAARTAWSLLRNCPVLPGQQMGGTIDAKKVTQFVSEARNHCREVDRLEVCDITLGNILARAPSGECGVWPHKAVRETLDLPEHGDVRRGLISGLINKRGVTSRAYREGGSLERDLAEDYRRHAKALHSSYPLLAATLDSVAASYDHDARREDTQAKLRIEGS